MKYFKTLSLIVALCMIFTVVPMMATGAADDVVAGDTPAAEPEPTATAAPEATEEPAGESTAAPEPTDSVEPEATEAPTEEPQVSGDPTATATPSPTATAGTYNIEIDANSYSRIKTYVNSKAATSAAKGARVSVKARASRGYYYTSLYYTDSDNNKQELAKTQTNSIETTFTMPESDITFYAEVEEMTDSQLYSDAQKQYNDVTADLNTYTSRYINNSSSYDATDIREMRSLITEAREVLSTLKEEYTDFNDYIRDDTVTSNIRNDLISVQNELDVITDRLEELDEKMGGSGEEGTYAIDVTVTRGGRVTFTGALSATLVATNSGNTSDYYSDIPYGVGLTIRFGSSNGYTLNNVKINNRSVNLNGTSLQISAANIDNYVVNGVMEIYATFGYGNNGYTGQTWGNSSSSGNSGYYGGTPYYDDTTASPTAEPLTSEQYAAFNDIAGVVDWAIPAINALSSLGVINGMGEGKFEPQNPVTREQFAKMIVGVMGYAVDNNATPSFSDDIGDWYTPYIAAAVQNGIINGRGDGSFGVGANITRQEIAAIIYRTQGSPATEAHAFPDSANISDYAVDAVSYLYNQGIATGDDSGNFNPQNPATRAEAAKMLYGVYLLIQQQQLQQQQ